MKILKRNQIIIFVISLMLITAGYLNYTTNNNIETGTEIADLGDATLVSSTNSNNTLENAIVPNNEEANITSNNETENAQDVKANPVAAQDEYFTKSKLERDNMYSQNLETYQSIYNNGSSIEEQKTSAMKEITKINNEKNAIMIAENLIMAKGFEDVIIFINKDSISVIIKAKELTPDQIAQLQNIISRELKTPLDKVNISTK